MTCKQIKTQLGAYLDGLMKEEAKAEFDVHIARCKKCRQEVEETREALQWIKQADLLEPPPDLRSTVIKKLHTEKRQKRLLPGLIHFTAAAAVFVLLLAANLLAVNYKPDYMNSDFENEAIILSQESDLQSKRPKNADNYSIDEAVETGSNENAVLPQTEAKKLPDTAAADTASSSSGIIGKFLLYLPYINLAGLVIILLLAVSGLWKRKEKGAVR